MKNQKNILNFNHLPNFNKNTQEKESISIKKARELLLRKIIKKLES